MGEEDNPDIRKYLGDFAKYQTNVSPFGTAYWGGTSAAQRIRPTALRHWFLRRVISPTFSSMHINVTQDRISSLGWDTWDEFWNQMASYNMATITADLESLLAHNIIDTNNIITDTDVNAVSAASDTFTGGANTNTRIRYLSVNNATRAATWRLTYTPSGGTAGILLQLSQVDVQADYANLIGGMSRQGATGSFQNSIESGIWIQPSDTLVCLCTNYVAADVTTYVWVEEPFTM